MKNEEVEGKKLPQAFEIERVVLGSIVLDSICFDRVAKDFSVELFHDLKHKLIAKAIIELYKDSLPIDLITIVKKIQEYDKLEQVGGIKYLSDITSGIASSSNIDFHIKILQEEALRRNVIYIANKAIQKSFDVTEDIFEVFNDVQYKLDGALKKVVNYEIQSVGEIHAKAISESIKILQTGKKSGITTGLRLLDNVTNGWQKSDLIILAGRPGMGKTASVVSMALHPAVNLKTPIGIFSLEMSSEQLVARMQSQYSEINVSKIVKKQLTEDEIVIIERRSEKLKEAPIYIDDTPNISLLELKGKVRKMVKENDVQLIIIDYLQLMRSGVKTQSREQEIAEISRGLKGLAKEVNIPVLALSQLSRSVEARGGDKKPMLSDLRESGSIEQDADMVIFCYRPEYYGIDIYDIGTESLPASGLFMFIIAKHRNGELGEIPLKFIHEQTKITDYELSFRGFTPIEIQEPPISNINLQPNNSFEKQIQNQPLNDQDFFTDSTPF